MQRKTNLFYTTNNDSNFLTFSNFTEALTGNFLATDWKVYPSKFMCLLIPSLTPETKESFIKNHLVAYYENKLAFLRDYFVSEQDSDVETYDVEEDIDSLAWLLDTIRNYDSEAKVTFVGEVTEFDYKGSYADTICIIDSNDNINYYSIGASSNGSTVTYDNSGNLYGWTSNELANTPYSGLAPVLDGGGYGINSTYRLNKDNTQETSIKFNVIIPLFDIIDINYVTNFDNIEETGSMINSNGQLVDNQYGDAEIKSINNPLGIWFSDRVIELIRDEKYAPSWSLTISSQFKPFPYSNNYLKNDITVKDNQQAFATYAKVLGEQASLANDLFNLTVRTTKVEQNVESLMELHSLKATLEETINNLDSIIANKIAELKNLDALIDEKINEKLENQG